MKRLIIILATLIFSSPIFATETGSGGGGIGAIVNTGLIKDSIRNPIIVIPVSFNDMIKLEKAIKSGTSVY